MPRAGPALACALLYALAGCGEPSGPAFQKTCPAWSEGLGVDSFHRLFDANRSVEDRRTDALGEGRLRDEGRPLDRVALDFHRPEDNVTGWRGVEVRDAVLEVRFHRSDDGRSLLAYDPAFGPRSPTANPGVETWTFPAGSHTNFTLYVDLSGSGEAAGAPTMVVAEWSFRGGLDGDPRTPSFAVLGYDATMHYRAC